MYSRVFPGNFRSQRVEGDSFLRMSLLSFHFAARRRTLDLPLPWLSEVISKQDISISGQVQAQTWVKCPCWVTQGEVLNSQDPAAYFALWLETGESTAKHLIGHQPSVGREEKAGDKLLLCQYEHVKLGEQEETPRQALCRRRRRKHQKRKSFLQGRSLWICPFAAGAGVHCLAAVGRNRHCDIYLAEYCVGYEGERVLHWQKIHL